MVQILTGLLHEFCNETVLNSNSVGLGFLSFTLIRSKEKYQLFEPDLTCGRWTQRNHLVPQFHLLLLLEYWEYNQFSKLIKLKNSSFFPHTIPIGKLLQHIALLMAENLSFPSYVFIACLFPFFILPT